MVCLPWHDASSILPNWVKLRFKLSAFIICLLSWLCNSSGPVQLSAVTSLPRARVKRKTRDGPGLRHHGAHGGCALNAAFRFGFYSVTTQLSCSKFAVSGSLSEGQLNYFDERMAQCAWAFGRYACVHCVLPPACRMPQEVMPRSGSTWDVAGLL